MKAYLNLENNILIIKDIKYSRKEVIKSIKTIIIISR